MSPGSIRLPINAIPPVIGKLRHAYPLSILSVNDAYLPWFHSNFIQLFWPRARGFPHATLDFFYPPQYPSLPLLDTQQHQQARPDLAHHLAVHRHARPRHPLDHSPHF